MMRTDRGRLVAYAVLSLILSGIVLFGPRTTDIIGHIEIWLFALTGLTGAALILKAAYSRNFGLALIGAGLLVEVPGNRSSWKVLGLIVWLSGFFWIAGEKGRAKPTV